MKRFDPKSLSRALPFLLLLLAVALPSDMHSYPIDGYRYSQIRRLVRLQMIHSGELKDAPLVPGSLKSIDSIALHLRENALGMDSLPAPDPDFQKKINALFPVMHESYSLSVLDVTPGRPVRYAERQPLRGFQPGSVGKLAVVTGLFTELANLYPDDYEARRQLMCNKFVRAGSWALPNEHTVPIFDPVKKTFQKRTLVASDVFTLFEWADHMLSVSSNGAASVVWREAILMRAFGQRYPELTEEEAAEYFKSTPKSELSDLAISVVNDPLRKLGISDDEWRLGSLFTRGGKTMIPGKGGSTGTTRGLMKFLLEMEKGKVVDAASSLEIKRLMYMTDRRIRYASAPELKEAAVYFKSGSLYKCKPEEGFQCGKYKGNVDNYMNSVAIVEHADGTTYLVTLMSNVLRKNSGSDHMRLASLIDKAIRQP